MCLLESNINMFEKPMHLLYGAMTFTETKIMVRGEQGTIQIM